ncbi:serine/threonine-protein kinase D6PKL2 isoform X2 [Physcomitrium patens]|uniref:non-specific serine/threonine protein kinase n=1 Tax=Physcomitrium patens TaxID=3218 RepID=A0A2K1JEG4_PHYPA|nr:serine/threonine-protein kinase D6PKL2-like isoform X2 [Physcomitrium patens]PNR39925.1 hypothetical protein PHYPA_020205 [Physcomitrium patens]|eukprot:XP_024396942.1 serine/threonine-protein kinase D6PKL2-like isoform X2 [Physcomitrella patens]
MHMSVLLLLVPPSRSPHVGPTSLRLCCRKPNSNSKPHKSNDINWEAIQALRARDGSLGLSHFKLLRRLGCGDIGSVYLCELRGMDCYFAMKVMDKSALATRKKLSRAQTEKEILASLDHPFLPTLYAHFDTAQFSCLVMEYCSGGDLHSLRQKQAGKCFSDMAAKFYAAEILLALEYLHMMGVVYRDLKPENVLVREDGHIMLSDFDLSLRCAVNPSLIMAQPNLAALPSRNGRRATSEIWMLEPQQVALQSCVPMISSQYRFRKPMSLRSKRSNRSDNDKGTASPPSMPELVVEPTEVRSMSFVGTHEYLAPEIISGDGHGSSVDWWTFGIFLYELLYAKTPFKGADNELTLTNVVSHPLIFPPNTDTVNVPDCAKDLIRGLLMKDPMKRIGSIRGAGEIKAHPFFEGVNWALIRCACPPEVPKPYRSELAAVAGVPTLGQALADEKKKATGWSHEGDNAVSEFECF